LIERWTPTPDESALLKGKTGATRLGFAVLLRFSAGEGLFPESKGEVPGQIISYLGKQAGVPAEYVRYDWRGRSVKYHRAEIRGHFGFREITEKDAEELSRCRKEVLPGERDREKLRVAVYGRCRSGRVEPPLPGRVGRLVASSARAYHERFCEEVRSRLSSGALRSMDALLETGGSFGCPGKRALGRRTLGAILDQGGSRSGGVGDRP